MGTWRIMKYTSDEQGVTDQKSWHGHLGRGIREKGTGEKPMPPTFGRKRQPLTLPFETDGISPCLLVSLSSPLIIPI